MAQQAPGRKPGRLSPCIECPPRGAILPPGALPFGALPFGALPFGALREAGRFHGVEQQWRAEPVGQP